MGLDLNFCHITGGLNPRQENRIFFLFLATINIFNQLRKVTSVSKSHFNLGIKSANLHFSSVIGLKSTLLLVSYQ